MTESQEIRTMRDREFSMFGASRFVLYIVGSFAMYLAGVELQSVALQIAGALFGIGATIEIARRLYYKFKN